MWILIILSIVVLVIFLWQISNLISVFFGSLYVKTQRDVIQKALKSAEVKKGDVFYDLGCGNGDVLIEAAKIGAKTVGFEISPYYYILSKLRTLFFRGLYYFTCSSMIEGIDVRFKNILDVDLGNADVVYVYLLPKLLSQIDFSKVKKDARIISIGFAIKGIKGKKYRIFGHNIFIYQ